MFLLYVLLPDYLVTHFARSRSLTTSLATLMTHSTPLPTPFPSPALVPVTIIIPKLGIQTAVEAVGLTDTNNMDVPKNAADVAWYMHGPKPSEEGNAVIAGHYDTPTGRPAIFYHLRILEIGDEIEIISQNGVHSTFAVVEKSTIPYDVFPSDYIFKTRPGKNLNLITCGGLWDSKKKVYSDRIVIYTTLKEAKV